MRRSLSLWQHDVQYSSAEKTRFLSQLGVGRCCDCVFGGLSPPQAQAIVTFMMRSANVIMFFYTILVVQLLTTFSQDLRHQFSLNFQQIVDIWL